MAKVVAKNWTISDGDKNLSQVWAEEGRKTKEFPFSVHLDVFLTKDVESARDITEAVVKVIEAAGAQYGWVDVQDGEAMEPEKVS